MIRSEAHLTTALGRAHLPSDVTSGCRRRRGAAGRGPYRKISGGRSPVHRPCNPERTPRLASWPRIIQRCHQVYNRHQEKRS
ncbi:hypothetical protein NDU88_000804 [Pleurodeles waltl]|uniref:Uncharacterized protein n=1 Tax=Pleurodeles waltl TaxID=8319 RepID=A0AAV7RB24_PLEWA|nr:hypothetical protein NDU88_000804 [Pleurodeles waltl]